MNILSFQVEITYGELEKLESSAKVRIFFINKILILLSRYGDVLWIVTKFKFIGVGRYETVVTELSKK